MSLPPGWIANYRPAEAETSYTGDPTSGWEAGVGGAHGIQPKGPNNPDGDVLGVPVMSITAAASARLDGPQPGL